MFWTNLETEAMIIAEIQKLSFTERTSIQIEPEKTWLGYFCGRSISASNFVNVWVYLKILIKM